MSILQEDPVVTEHMIDDVVHNLALHRVEHYEGLIANDYLLLVQQGLEPYDAIQALRKRYEK